MKVVEVVIAVLLIFLTVGTFVWLIGRIPKKEPIQDMNYIELKDLLVRYEIFKTVNGLDRSSLTHDQIIEEFLDSFQ